MKGLDRKCAGLKLEYRIIEVFKEVLDAGKSDNFSKKFEATVALSDIVNQDPLFVIVPDEDTGS